MTSTATRTHVTVERVQVTACRIPTDLPESDGTLTWRDTTIVLVQIFAGGVQGLGYTYADRATARFVEDELAPMVVGQDAMEITLIWNSMVRAIRNLGRPGVASMAISAMDNALWDLKARLLDQPLATLLGKAQTGIRAYGSGGFTSYTPAQLERQLGGWVELGLTAVKMKVGRDPLSDVERVRAARRAIGPDTELFVDANGAYSRKQALAFAERFSFYNVAWFEEPVSSDDLEGLHLIRDRAPAGMEIAAGEYGYDLIYFARMLDARAVDVLQTDVTRCGGISEFLRVGALCQARGIPLSTHTAPALSLHACCALPVVRHLEYFHDHVRIEAMLLDGVVEPVEGMLYPDLSRPGHGLSLKEDAWARYRVYPS
jgi:L-alanine-DL-glutamate epimerase-like enolase superfamily enzyme